VIPYKRDYERYKSKNGRTILKLGTIHLLTESFPTSYRPLNSDKNWPKSIFPVWLLIGADTQKIRMGAHVHMPMPIDVDGSRPQRVCLRDLFFFLFEQRHTPP
jgi:hypothetical protein